MNTVTLKDLSGAAASSGNSLLSMVQMLSLSLGVAAAGGLLATFADLFGREGSRSLGTFHATYLCVGAITAISACIFWQLPEDVVPAVEHPSAEVHTSEAS